jgi:late competence protein required for DNA uptake (superfamily II DNA/RNA helicase)
MEAKEKSEDKKKKSGMNEKLACFKEVKEKLAEIEREMYQKKWDFACEICKLKTLVFHSLNLYPNEIRFFCRSCSVAGRIADRDKKKIQNFIKKKLATKEALEFEFINDINDRQSN